jgi:adenylate kinase
MNIIILGPQGSGKGTQARILSEKLGLYYFEMGDFLRNLAKNDSVIDEIINQKGELLPDHMFFFAMKDLLEEKMIKEGKGMILDGFPRTIEQYKLLKNWFNEKSIKVNKAIVLEISEKETIKRLSARRICENCGEVYNLITKIPPKAGCKCGAKLIQRKDDEPVQIKKRLTLYKYSTKPLLTIFAKEGILLKINGEQPIEEITKEILSRLQK